MLSFNMLINNNIYVNMFLMLMFNVNMLFIVF